MLEVELQMLCEQGQRELMETRYLDAARILSLAEHQAWDARAFDTLARLYLPLQEARRQIRQRCGEGAVRLRLSDMPVDQILRENRHGQLLVAGSGMIQPAIEIRKLAAEQNLYLETFLAAKYPVLEGEFVIVIVPMADATLPVQAPRSADDLRLLLPPHCLIIREDELPPDAAAGNAETFAGVMDLWERLHTPFLQAALAESDPIQRMQAYRTAIAVDPACELAHQFLADIARTLSRQR